MQTKQVIIIRKDLKMRRGKEITQGSHASMAFLTKQFEYQRLDEKYEDYTVQLNKAMQHWLDNSFIKVVCKVNSREELMEIYKNAFLANLPVNLITDDGRTEFHGVPTVTCCAIGPAESSEVDKVTKDLELY